MQLRFSKKHYVPKISSAKDLCIDPFSLCPSLLSFNLFMFSLSFIKHSLFHYPFFSSFLNFINFSFPSKSLEPIEPITTPHTSILFFVLFFPLWLVITNAIKTHYKPLPLSLVVVEWKVATWLGHAYQIPFLPFFVV